LSNAVRVIKSKILRWAGHVTRMQEGRSVFKILTGKPTGKRPLVRPRRRWDDNITSDLTELSINTRNWVDSAQDMDYIIYKLINSMNYETRRVNAELRNALQ
jgi:hypothetical protein